MAFWFLHLAWFCCKNRFWRIFYPETWGEMKNDEAILEEICFSWVDQPSSFQIVFGGFLRQIIPPRVRRVRQKSSNIPKDVWGFQWFWNPDVGVGVGKNSFRILQYWWNTPSQHVQKIFSSKRKDCFMIEQQWDFCLKLSSLNTRKFGINPSSKTA